MNEEIIKYLNDLDIAKTLSEDNMEDVDFQIDILNNENIKEESIKYLAKSLGESFKEYKINSKEISINAPVGDEVAEFKDQLEEIGFEITEDSIGDIIIQ